MDERLTEWLHLLPPHSQLVLHEVPEAIHQLFETRCANDGDTLVGWRTQRSELRLLDRFNSAVLLNPRGISTSTLRAAGFQHSQEFAVLPSFKNARILVQLDSPHAAARGLDFFIVHHPISKLVKSAAAQLARAGTLRHVCDTVLLARRARSDLEAQLEQLTHLSPVHLAISTGAPSQKRKPTVQIMTGKGRVVAFAKYATTAAAKASIRRESSWLKALARHGQLDGAIPTLIGELSSLNRAVSVLTPGPTLCAPNTFGTAHQAFLARLAGATGQRLDFLHSEMWQSLQDTLERLTPQLSQAWRERLIASLTSIRAGLAGRPLRLSTAHRDFGPWNMRLWPDGSLFVLDWEAGQAQSTPLYDSFNFHFLVDLKGYRSPGKVYRQTLQACRRWSVEADYVDERLLPHFFLAYLTDHVLRRLATATLPYDKGTSLVLDIAAELLDHQGEWLPA